MSDRTYSLTPEQLSSSLLLAILAGQGIEEKDAGGLFECDMAAIHFHDGSQSPIAWNDIQAIKYFNQFC